MIPQSQLKVLNKTFSPKTRQHGTKYKFNQKYLYYTNFISFYSLHLFFDITMHQSLLISSYHHCQNTYNFILFFLFIITIYNTNLHFYIPFKVSLYYEFMGMFLHLPFLSLFTFLYLNKLILLHHLPVNLLIIIFGLLFF